MSILVDGRHALAERRLNRLYGPVTQSLPFWTEGDFRVPLRGYGPQEGYLAERVNLSSILDPRSTIVLSVNRPVDPAARQLQLAGFRNIGRAYLDGELDFTFSKPVPITDVDFLLPLRREVVRCLRTFEAESFDGVLSNVDAQDTLRAYVDLLPIWTLSRRRGRHQTAEIARYQFKHRERDGSQTLCITECRGRARMVPSRGARVYRAPRTMTRTTVAFSEFPPTKDAFTAILTELG